MSLRRLFVAMRAHHDRRILAVGCVSPSASRILLCFRRRDESRITCRISVVTPVSHPSSHVEVESCEDVDVSRRLAIQDWTSTRHCSQARSPSSVRTCVADLIWNCVFACWRRVLSRQGENRRGDLATGRIR